MDYLKVQEKDFEAIVDLYITTFNQSFFNESWTKTTASKRLRDLFNTPGFLGYCIKDHHQLAGVILGRYEQYDVEVKFFVQELCVNPAYQSQGLGTQLLSYLENQIKTEVQTIYLWTLNHVKTLNFYQNNGYELENQIVLSKKL